MAKFIILGNGQPESKPSKKCTVSSHILMNTLVVSSLNRTAEDPIMKYDFVELICKNYAQSLDIIFAYKDGKRDEGTLFLGHWNDGIIE